MISAKINLLYSERKSITHKDQMAKMRQQFLSHRKRSALTSLIEVTPFKISTEQLNILINFANEGIDDAIIHLGNLLIDKVVSVHEFSKQTLVLKPNKYLIWLFRILHQQRYFVEQYLYFLLDFIQKDQGNFIEEHALPLLNQLLKENIQFARFLLKQNPNCLLSICKGCKSSNEKKSQECYSILSTISSDCEETTCLFFNVAGYDNFVKIIENGLLKTSTKGRALCCQLISNVIIDYQMPGTIIKSLLVMAKSEKNKVLVEISYALSHLVQHSSNLSIVRAVHNGLIPTLVSLTKSSKQQISENAFKAIKTVHMLLSEFDQLDCQMIRSQIREDQELLSVLEKMDICF